MPSIISPYTTDNFRLTSPYGNRILNGSTEFHKGADLVCDSDKRVVAIGNGVIMVATQVLDKSNLTWQWGKYIHLKLDNGMRVFYCHLSEIKVKSGQLVKKGDVIGCEGSTGFSMGSHLHLELRPNSNSTDSIDCTPFLGIKNKIGQVQPIKSIDYKKNVVSRLGLESQTIDYIDKYKYSTDLWRKIDINLNKK